MISFCRRVTAMGVIIAKEKRIARGVFAVLETGVTRGVNSVFMAEQVARKCLMLCALTSLTQCYIGGRGYPTSQVCRLLSNAYGHKKGRKKPALVCFLVI